MIKRYVVKVKTDGEMCCNVGGYILLYLLCQEKYVEKYKLVGGVPFLKKGVG